MNVGDNLMSFRVIAPQQIPAPVRSPSQTPSSRGASADARGDGVPCPSCGKRYAKTAKICVACGVDIRTGRPLITSQALDENVLYANAESTISIISWVIPFGLYPIASEAFGGRKPIVIWSIAILTVLISIWFFFAAGIYASDRGDGAPSVAGLMLWSGHPMNAADLERELQNVPGVNGSLRKEEIKKIAESAVDDSPEQFHFYQLITHAFLHGGIMHLAGNMLFLLVFGTRVNAFIGNVATAIVYPILAIGAGACHFIAMRSGMLHPMLGASGAIMGLAGMYFVLFPVHRVFMAIWLRMGLFTGFRLSMNVWPLRGFWVVLFYIAFDVVFTAFGIKDGTAHWAHLGGFGFGMLIALILLLTRLVDAHRADLISVTLGKGAWRFLGRPGEAMPARAA